MIRHGWLFAWAALLLFLGPLLAGIGGAGWPVLPVFALIFMLWLAAMRPDQFGQSARDWMAPAPWFRLLATLAAQFVLVALLLGMGRLIGLALPVPGFSLAWPLALSALSIPLSRAVHKPMPREMDAFLDDALRAINQASDDLRADTAPPDPTGQTLTPGDKSLIEMAVIALDSLSDEEADLPGIERILSVFPKTNTAIALLERLRAAPPQAAMVRTDVVLSFRTDVIEHTNYDDDQWDAVERALETDDPATIGLMAEVVLRAYRELGDRAVHLNLPPDTDLLAKAAQLADRGFEATAHSLRAVYKARRFAQDAYDRETRPDPDDR